MKQIKKLFSLLLAVIVLLGCGVTSFADATASHMITILNHKPGHVYQAYQIFKGDLNEGENVLSNVEWGSGVDGFGLLLALQELDASPYVSCENAADVAEILTGFSNNSAELDTFAQVAQNYLTLQAAGTSQETESPYTIQVTGDGYYLIQDGADAAQGDALTKIILQVAKDVQIQVKADAPSLEKKILEDGQKVDYNNGAVGDTVEYLLTSRVPDMDGYEKYFFIVHDVLSEGLTFQKESVQVRIGTDSLEKEAYQVVTEELSDGCSFEIVFKNFLQYKNQKDEKIEISYTAVLNEKAVIGSQGNDNKAHLQYSNNPNAEVNGDPENPDKPGVGDGTGITPDDVTITYLTGIELVKIDDSEDEIRLKGAEFTLSGEKLNKVKTVKGIYKEDQNGTYYKRKDGTFTEIVPVEDTVDQYESTTILYMYDTIVEWETTTEQVTERAMVGADGELHFYGLAEGTYKIEEIKAPDGYNLLAQPITVVITLNGPEEVTAGEEEAAWKYTLSGAVEQEETVAPDGIIKLSVVNKAGTILPSTGGAGVTAFYLIGTLTAVAAIGMNKGRKKEDEIC